MRIYYTEMWKELNNRLNDFCLHLENYWVKTKNSLLSVAMCLTFALEIYRRGQISLKCTERGTLQRLHTIMLRD